jgi:hypothetical protein
MSLHSNDIIALETLCNTLKERFKDSPKEQDANEIISKFHDLIMNSEIDDNLIEDMSLAVKIAQEISGKITEIQDLEIENWALYEENKGEWQQYKAPNKSEKTK